jgi:agmatine deiminase
MYADWETNTVFISDLLPRRFPAVANGIKQIMAENNIPVKEISNTKDIWCRDYYPIQVDAKRFIQFTYKPDYLKGYEDKITPPQKRYPIDPLVLDGGNLVVGRDKVIMTDKIYRENPGWDRKLLRTRLQSILQSRLTIIPKQPFDYVGHSDGVVRFIDEQTVIVNDYIREDQEYGDRVKALLRREGFRVEPFPYFYTIPPKCKYEIDTAVGIYLNYLRVGDVVVLPTFDLPQDDQARQFLQRLLPKAKIFQLPATQLAEAGGVFNCVTSTVRCYEP